VCHWASLPRTTFFFFSFLPSLSLSSPTISIVHGRTYSKTPLAVSRSISPCKSVPMGLPSKLTEKGIVAQSLRSTWTPARSKRQGGRSGLVTSSTSRPVWHLVNDAPSGEARAVYCLRPRTKDDLVPVRRRAGRSQLPRSETIRLSIPAKLPQARRRARSRSGPCPIGRKQAGDCRNNETQGAADHAEH